MLRQLRAAENREPLYLLDSEMKKRRYSVVRNILVARFLSAVDFISVEPVESVSCRDSALKNLSFSGTCRGFSAAGLDSRQGMLVVRDVSAELLCSVEKCPPLRLERFGM